MCCIQAFPASSPQKQEHLGHFSGSMSSTIHPREGSANEKKLTQAPEVAPGDPKVPQNERGGPVTLVFLVTPCPVLVKVV